MTEMIIRAGIVVLLGSFLAAYLPDWVYDHAPIMPETAKALAFGVCLFGTLAVILVWIAEFKPIPSTPPC